MITISPETLAFFKAAGVFRVRSNDKARERFDEAVADWRDDDNIPHETGDDDALFAALIEKRDADKAAKIAEEAEKERKREAKLAKRAAMPVAAGVDSADEHVSFMPHGRYVLTAAQNNTHVDKVFLDALHAYCRHMGATLLVGRLTYNKAGFCQPDVNGGDEALWYDKSIRDYIVEGTLNLGNSFHFAADSNIIPTAKWPTSGFDGITPAGVGALLPATKIELRVGAANKGGDNKVIASTGAVTKRNYIMRKTGAIAAITHNIGALFVDTETGDIRHLEKMAGSRGFYDLGGFYTGDDEIIMGLGAGDIAAFQPGDIHAEKMDDENLENVLCFIREYQPDNIVIHDVLDFSSRNHHNIKDPTFIHRQYVEGNTVRNDLIAVANVLDQIADTTRGTVHIVESNHDLAINTWLKNADFKVDPINATVYLECMLALYKHQEERPRDYFNMLGYAYREIGGGSYSDVINFHETDEDLIIAKVQMGNHGHNGANGSKGSPKQFATLGIAMNTGHTHSPSIYGGVYTAGVTASLEMGYNVGASSWAIAHVVTYRNGQRQIIFM